MNEQELAPEWMDWLVDNYVEGVDGTALVRHLVEANVPETLAKEAVKELTESTVLRSLRRRFVVRDQLHSLVELKRRLETPGLVRFVERRRNVSREEFFERYYFQNQPVVLTDVADEWPALELWKDIGYFARKFGDEVIDVCMGRESDPECDRNFAKHAQKMTMRKYVDWVATTEESNDGYLISNNRLMEKEAFFSLLSDVIPPTSYVDPTNFRTFMSFWLGPSGTKTPLHHDGNNILFCQVVGRKEFFLVSPLETGLLYDARGYYAKRSVPTDFDEEGVRPADEAFAYPAVRIVLQPGEALFLPVGWWHQVRALDRSVSLSFLNFLEPNHFEWYGPGKFNGR